MIMTCYPPFSKRKQVIKTAEQKAFEKDRDDAERLFNRGYITYMYKVIISEKIAYKQEV